MPPPRIRGLVQAVRKPSELSARRTLFTSRPSASRTKARAWYLAGTVLGGCILVYASDSRAGIHRWLVIPVLHTLTADDPEKSHVAAVKVMSSSFAPVDKGRDDEEVLGFDLWGRHFSNPIGLAAGFDKHGEAIDGLLGLGFGYVEIGSVTPEAQEGNPKPRFFRLPETQSVINRYGFNSEGHTVVLSRLRERIIAFARDHTFLLPDVLYESPSPREIAPLDPVDRLLSSPSGRDAAIPDAIGLPRSLLPGRVLAINLGKNKASNPDSLDDYLEGVRKLGPYADVLVVNVSSPNTPGLRQLQKRGMLEELLFSVVEARDQLKGKVRPAVVVKISPDMSDDEIEDVAETALETKIDGVIVSNTTISRPAAAGSSPTLLEVGGLSGPAVKPLAIRTLASLYNATEGKVPLIGCGGVTTAQDAIDFARAGASFVQLYTSFGYHGPGLPRELKDDLSTILRGQQRKWPDLVGVDAQRLVAPRMSKRDRETERLRQELESVLANLAEGREVRLPDGTEQHAVQAAAGLSDQETAMPQYVVPSGGDVVAASTSLQSTVPSAMQSSDPPESGVLESSSGHPLHPGAIPILILEQAGDIPAATEAAKTPLSHPEAVLPDFVEAAGQQAGKLAEKTAEVVAQVTASTSDAIKQATGKAEEVSRPSGGKTEVPLLKLFSSFGERPKAGHDGGKRLV